MYFINEIIPFTYHPVQNISHRKLHPAMHLTIALLALNHPLIKLGNSAL